MTDNNKCKQALELRELIRWMSRENVSSQSQKNSKSEL